MVAHESRWWYRLERLTALEGSAVNKTALPGNRHRVGAIARVQLGKNTLGAGFDSLFRHIEFPPDVTVDVSGGDELRIGAIARVFSRPSR
jgi:hypothetical protein